MRTAPRTAARNSSRALLLGLALTAGLTLSACAAAPAPEPDPIDPPTTEPAPPTAEPTGLQLPRSCDEAFSDAQLDGFYEQQLVLNPEFLAEPDTPAVPESLLATVQRWSPLVCTWTLNVPSDYAIVVSFAAVTDAEAASAVIAFEDLGFGSSSWNEGTRLILNTAASEDTGLSATSEAHYFGQGGWIGVFAAEPDAAGRVLEATTGYLLGA